MRDNDGAAFLEELGQQAVGIMQQKAPLLKEDDPRWTPGALRAACGMRPGRDNGIPFVDVGVVTGLPNRYDFDMEFGTVYDRAQPFVRPAIAAIAGGLGDIFVKTTRASTRQQRGYSSRARRRSAVRTSLRGGQITARQARVIGAAVASKYAVRIRRRR